MCPLKREQARRETQQWVMRRLPTADSIVEKVEKVGHELINVLQHCGQMTFSLLPTTAWETSTTWNHRLETRPNYWNMMTRLCHMPSPMIPPPNWFTGLTTTTKASAATHCCGEIQASYSQKVSNGVTRCSLTLPAPPPSNTHHLSNCACLEVKTEDY